MEIYKGFKKIEEASAYEAFNSSILVIEKPLSDPFAQDDLRICLYDYAFIFTNGNDNKIELFGNSFALVNGFNNKIICNDYSGAILFNNNTAQARGHSTIWAHDYSLVKTNTANVRIKLNDFAKLSCANEYRMYVLI